VGEEWVADADVRSDCAAKIAGQQDRAENRGTRDHKHDQTDELDDPNAERFCDLVKRMSVDTQFLYISHNKITMEMAAQLVGVTMQESGVSRVVAVDIEEALRMKEELAA